MWSFFGVVKFVSYISCCCNYFWYILIYYSPPSKYQEPFATSAPVNSNQLKQGIVNSLSLRTSWYKDGFNSILMTNFTITNNSKYNVKDIFIDCTCYGASATALNRPKNNIYQQVTAGQTITVRDMNMGFINQQVTSVICYIVGIGSWS